MTLLVAVTTAFTAAETGLGAEPPKIDRIFPAGGSRGSQVSVELAGKPGDEALQVWTSSAEVSCQVAADGKTAQLTASDAAEPGIHWLRFYNSAGATGLLPFVVSTVTEVSETEPNDRLSQTQAELPASAVVNGVLAKAGDVDCAAVRLQAGQTLVASLQANRDLGSPMDAVLQLLNEQGTVLAQNDDDHGFDPQIVLTCPADGLYYARLFAFPATPNSTIRFAGGSDYVYRLTLTTDAFIDHPMPLAVTAGQQTQVEFSGWNLPDAQQSTTVQLAGDNSPAVVATSAAGSTVVDVVDYPALQEANVSETLTAPVCVSGRIQNPGEVDRLKFSGKQVDQVLIEVSAVSRHSLLDPVVVVRDAADKQLQQADDIGSDDRDARLTVKLPADGEYTVEVTDRFGHGGPRCFYLLTCKVPQAACQLSVKDSQFTLSADKPLEISVSVDRQNGFNGKLQITAEGLPDGVQCTPAESLPEGDSSKSVKLQLTATSTSGLSAPFQIVATSQPADGNESATADSQRFIAATTAVTGSRVQLPFWLTVLAAAEEAAAEETAE